ncbi:PAS domain-containing sensor histidine kinase [Azonexus sp.]|uniref:sensor histidine kinase n=1 Tax=Azonexus sp. TaxID=1872668 RepID=UPI0035AF81AE
MTGWLSATWEASWRSLQYFNLYRLVIACLLLLATVFPQDWTSRLNLGSNTGLFLLIVVYAAAVAGGLLFSMYEQRRFNLQLTIQVGMDVSVVGVLMFVGGGVGSGLGVLLLVSLAAASLVGRGRLVLLYAALATLVVLAIQAYVVLLGLLDAASLFQAGLLSAGFFATAVLARLLGQRAMTNEDLARRRGVALDNQIRISQQVVEHMQDGVLIVGRDGKVVRSNPVAQAMLSLPGAGACVLAGALPRLAAAFELWATGRGPDSLRFSAPDGRELDARFARTQSSDGECLVFLEDAERIKARAQQLKLAALGRLTASIAHEIRNPLSAISHAGELLREERRGEMQDRLLRILGDNVIRLDRIVSDILELGRQSRATPSWLNLDEFCRNFVEHLASSEGLAADVIRIEGEAPAGLCFDRAHLHRVLWNLVGNALRHAGRDSGAVCLRIVPAPAEGRVELHVTDQGPGIPEELREQVFEPFFTTHHQGTGLGLFIARELCAANGARLELLPSARGAHFVITGRYDTCPLPEANAASAAN